jgi:RND family efflux transporter MFP subunit
MNGKPRCAAAGVALFGIVGLAFLGGCGGSDAKKMAELPAPIISYAAPIEKTVTRYESATGRVEPIEQVDIRARVSGYLNSIQFQPGTEVKQGKVLFEIDPEPSKADLAKAKANQETAVADLATAQADLGRADTRVVTTKKDYDREEKVFAGGAGSAQARDKAKGDYDEATATSRSATAKVQLARARIDEAKAAVRSAELNLGYCTIAAPITGLVGDWLVTDGNLIIGGTGNPTKLTTIVAVDRMDVGFDVDEHTVQRIRQAVRDGRIKMNKPGEIPAECGLANHGTKYPIAGYVNFADNQVDPKTGTLRLKARFDNPMPPTGQRVLVAGMYAHVRVPIGEPVKSMFVPEEAFGSDQGISYLYVVGPENKAVRMDAVLGMKDGEMRVVESVQEPGKGSPRPLTAEYRVIVSGIQRIRPGMTVDPKPAKK